MKKTTFLIVGKHAVLEALKNPYRKIERVFLTEDAKKKLNRENQNLNFIIIGLILCVIIYYFKDLSLALGKTDRIPLILSIWSPIIALSVFTFIGVIQINEK